MEKNNDRSNEYAAIISKWINDAQPGSSEMPELIGKSRSELEKMYPGHHYIPYDKTYGNLELITDKGTIGCILKDGICTKALFISNEDDME